MWADPPPLRKLEVGVVVAPRKLKAPASQAPKDEFNYMQMMHIAKHQFQRLTQPTKMLVSHYQEMNSNSTSKGHDYK